MKALLLLAGVLCAGSATATILTFDIAESPAYAVVPTDQDDERPGPDSVRVAILLDAMSRTDPVACQMLSDQIGNFWSSDSEWGPGRLSDVRADIVAAKDSLSGQVRDRGAIRLLTATLASDSPCVRRIAARMLGRSTVADEELGRRLDDPSVRVREAALLAIGSHERPSLRPRVERLLRADDDEPVVAMAAWVLGELEDRASVEPLVDVLDHVSPRVRMTGAWALGSIEDRGAVPRLLPLLQDREAMVRWAAAEALGNIESVEAAPELERVVREDGDRRVRLQAIEALGNIETTRSVPVLADVVGGNDVELAVAAAEAISNLDLVRAPPQLVRATSSPDLRLRKAVVSALENIEDRTTAPALIPLVRDADPEIREAAINALGEMNAQQAKSAITAALEDRNPDVRLAAVEALAKLEDR